MPKDLNLEGKTLGVRIDLGEDWIGATYFRMKQEGLLPTFFHNDPTMGLRKFLDWAAKHIVLTCVYPTLDSLEPAGIVFINGIQCFGDESVAEVGEVFFRKTPRSHTLAFCKLGLEFCFETQVLSGVYGITPVKNRAAVMFLHRLGFAVSQPLPALTGWGGKASAAVISSMSREQWMAAREAA